MTLLQFIYTQVHLVYNISSQTVNILLLPTILKLMYHWNFLPDSNSLKITKSMTHLSSTHPTSFSTVFANETSWILFFTLLSWFLHHPTTFLYPFPLKTEGFIILAKDYSVAYKQWSSPWRESLVWITSITKLDQTQSIFSSNVRNRYVFTSWG